MKTTYIFYVTPSWIINTNITGRCDTYSILPANTEVILSNINWNQS